MSRSSVPATLARVPRRTLALIVSLLLTLLCVPGGLLSAPHAFAAGTDGGFEIDGNTVSNGADDWQSVTGVQGPVQDNVPSDTTVYSEQSKEDDAPSAWAPSGSPPKKSDFVNVWSYTHNQTISGNSHPFVDLAFSRVADTGTDGFYIELNKVQGGANGNGVYAPTRSENDLRFRIDEQGNGALALDLVSKWHNGAWVDLASVPSGVFDYAVNTGPVDMPGQAGIGADDFVEMSFDLYALLGLTPSCPALFGSATIRAYTGQSMKNLDDFVSGFKLDAGSTCSSLTIEKRDSQTNALLGGASFTIAPDPTPGSTATSLSVTDNQAPDSDSTPGVISIDPAEAGTYTISETGAPTGYLIDDTNGKTVIAPPGGSAPTKTFTDSLGQASFEKVDAVSGDHVPGATFELKATGGDAKTIGYDELVTDNDTTPAAGHVADANPADGFITVKNLYTGTYDVTETHAPNGYELDTSTLSLTVNAAHPNGTWAASSTFSEPRSKVTLTVLKIRAGTENDPGGPTVLPGAKFALYQMLGASPHPATDTKIGTCTTGADGTCSIQAEWGHTYYWVEVAPPPGYSLPENNVGTPFDVHKSDLANGITTRFSDDSTTINTTATDATVGGTIKDTATLGNLRSDATGILTFQVYGPFGLNDNITSTSCTANALLDTFNVNLVPGTSVYSSEADHTFTPATAGKYAWIATYSGDVDADGNVRDASVQGTCGDQGETSTVGKASPNITTQATSSDSTTGTIHDTAALHSFFAPAAGTVTFKLYTDCAAGPIFTSTVGINANGTATSGDYTLDNTHGTYYWSANYNGDGNNKATNQSNCGQVDANNNEVSRGPVLDSPHKYNSPGTMPGASTTDPTVSIFPSNNQVDYLVTVHNSGNATMHNVVVKDPLSTLSTYNGDAACGGDATNCTPTTATTTSCASANAVPSLVWTFDLPANGTAQLTFSVTVNSGDVNGDDIANTACVSNGGTSDTTDTTHNPVAFPILALAKHSTPLPREDGASGAVDLNSTIQYTLTISNSGAADATGAVVTDEIPAGTTYVNGTAACGAGSVTPCTASEGDVGGKPTASWNLTVPAGGSVDLTFSVTVDSGDVNGQIISNHGHFDWNNSSESGDSRTITHIVEFSIITATKNASPAPREDGASGIVHPGDAITYTIPVTNSGLAGTSVTVTDTVPTGTTYVANSAACGTGTANCTTSGPNGSGLISWTFDIAAGAQNAPATANVSFQVTVDATDQNGQILSNFATVNGVTTRTVTHEVTFPIVDVTKSSVPVSGTAANPTAVGLGDQIAYTLTVTNAGLQDANNFVVTDSIPAGTASNNDASCGDAPAQTCTVDEVNGVITWHLTVPAGSGTLGNVVPSTEHLTFSVTVDSGDANGTLIDNTASFSNAHTPGCDPADSTCPTNTTHHEVEFPVVDVHKSSDPASGTVQAPAPVSPGQTITYTLTVSNSGLQDANDVVVTDAVPTGTTSNNDASCGDAPAATCTVDETNGVITWHLTVPAGSGTLGNVTPTVEHVNFSVTVDAADVNGTLIDNTASFSNVNTPGCVPVSGQNPDCTTETTHHEVEFPVIGLNKSANPISGSIVQHGDQIDYTVTVTNSGLAAAPGTVITDNLPAHVTLVPGSINPPADSVTNGVITWTLDLPAATVAGQDVVPATVSLTYSVTVDNDAPEGATLVNEALVNGACPADSVCTTDHHVPTGDLTLVKHVNETTANYGDTLTYAFDAATTGALDQTNVEVTDVVPAEVSYVDGSAGCADSGQCDASYDSATRTVTWELGDMAHATVRHLVFKARIDTPPADDNGGIPEETIVNSGLVQSTETAITPSNKVKTVVQTVLGETTKRPKPPKVLPFTGASVPPGGAATLALLLIGVGVIMTAAGRKVEFRPRRS